MSHLEGDVNTGHRAKRGKNDRGKGQHACAPQNRNEPADSGTYDHAQPDHLLHGESVAVVRAVVVFLTLLL